jgi:hypothetical protein
MTMALPRQDLVEHFRFDAEFSNNCVKHVFLKSDRIRGLRKVKVVETWRREKKIGEGGFGNVWLEVEDEKATQRAVKQIQKTRITSSRIDYQRELLAMATLSKVSPSFRSVVAV